MSICILMTGYITGLRFFAFAHWCYFYLETDVAAAGKKKRGEKWHTFVFILNPLALIECLMGSV